MSGIGGIGGPGGIGGGPGGFAGAGGIAEIMALRQQIIQRSQLLQQVHTAPDATASSGATGGGFGEALKSALDGVNASQTNADNLTSAYEQGQTTDVAKVMLARQEASVGFEATLQVRNKLLSAYSDIMKFGV